MDKSEATRIVRRHVADWRSRSYAEIRELLLDGEQVEEIPGPSSTVYCVDVQARWDDRRRETIRVMIGIHDGGLRALVPLSADFIVAPDGSFVGE